MWIYNLSNYKQVVERLCNLKPMELRDDGGAEFEMEMSLKDPCSKIFLYKVRSSLLMLLSLLFIFILLFYFLFFFEVKNWRQKTFSITNIK